MQGNEIVATGTERAEDRPQMNLKTISTWIALLWVLSTFTVGAALAQVGGGVGGGVGAVPEPTVMTMLAFGLVGYGASRRRRQ